MLLRWLLSHIDYYKNSKGQKVYIDYSGGNWQSPFSKVKDNFEYSQFIGG